MEKYERILKSIGLENNEAIVYLEAIKLGTVQASIIGKKLGIPRTTARYACEELVKKQLMIKTQKGNSMLFTAENPQALKNRIIVQKNRLEDSENKVDSIMGDLTQLYNPYTKLPKVTFYEGEEGIKKVLDDALKSSEVIDGFVDIENLLKFGKNTNQYFTKKRTENKVQKRTIYENKKNIGDKFNQRVSGDIYNQIKFVKSNSFKIYISLMMYDGKINYISYKENNLFGVIIEDLNIYNFNKNIFNLLWDNIE